jgi:hypothetical protein
MKSYLFILSTIIGIVVFACGEEVSSRATIYPLSYGGEPPKGSASRESIRYERMEVDSASELQDRLLTIGYLGNVPEGIGHTLRASLWNSASVAGRLNKDSLFDTSFLLKLKGRVDGPSAGGLFTISMLSMLNGHELKPDVTMTGTILPDGSIGAVGGVRYKLEGAKEAGLKKVLIPEYLRVEIDYDKGEVIDLQKHGATLGLEVEFVRNLQDAYPHFTGKELRRSKLGQDFNASFEISLPSPLLNSLKQRTMDRFKDFNNALKKLRVGKSVQEYEFEDELTKIAVSAIIQTEIEGIFEEMNAGSDHMRSNQWIVAFEKVNTAYIALKALLIWRDSHNFELYAADKITDVSKGFMKELFKQRDLLSGFDVQSPVERDLLQARVLHDGLNVYTQLGIEDSFVMFQQFQLNKLLESSSRVPREEILKAGSRTIASIARKTLRAHKMAAIIEIGKSSKKEDALDLDLLAGAFTFRGEEGEKQPLLDSTKVEKWHLFSKTRNEILLENLKATLKAQDVESKASFDFDTRKALALLNLSNELEPPDAKTPFAKAVLMTKQEVEFAFAIVKTDVFGFSKEGFLGLISSARENARQGILRLAKMNFQMFGPRYDFLRADGMRSGDSEQELQALRLYMSAASVCQLLESCLVEPK